MQRLALLYLACAPGAAQLTSTGRSSVTPLVSSQSSASAAPSASGASLSAAPTASFGESPSVAPTAASTFSPSRSGDAVQSLSLTVTLSAAASASPFPSSFTHSASARVTEAPTPTPSVFVCPPGAWCPRAENTNWDTQPCPPGTYNPLFRSATAAACLPCSSPPGLACQGYSPDPAGKPCPLFHYCPGGAAVPILCAQPAACLVPGLAAPQSAAFLQVYHAFTMAGSGARGHRDGFGAAAAFTELRFSAVDPGTDTVYLTEASAHILRAVAPTGQVTTIAGAYNTPGYTGTALGQESRFSAPSGIAADPGGTGAVYISDTANCVIRKYLGGWVTLVAGLPGACTGKDTGPGRPGTFGSPGALAMTAAGFLYVADAGYNNSGTFKSTGPPGRFSVRRVNVASGSITLLAGGTTLFPFTPPGYPFTYPLPYPPGPFPIGFNGSTFRDILSLAAHPTSSVLYIVDSGLTAMNGGYQYRAHGVLVLQMQNEALPSGTVTLANAWGGGASGSSLGSLDGPSPLLQLVTSVAVNPVTGDVYLSEGDDGSGLNNQVRVIQSAPDAAAYSSQLRTAGPPSLLLAGGVTTTLAGVGFRGYVDGPLPNRFAEPTGLSVSPSGLVQYVVDSGNYALRAISVTQCPSNGYFCPSLFYPLACPTGSYCNGTAAPWPCPAGTFTGAMLAASAASCRACDAGAFCPQGAGFPSKCPAGRYQPAPGATSIAACLACAALPGWACGVGSTAAAGVICPVGSFCRGGDAPPTLCDCPGMCSALGLSSEPPASAVWGLAPLTSAASFSSPVEVAIDPYDALRPNTMYVGSSDDRIVYKVSPDGGAVSQYLSSSLPDWMDASFSAARFLGPTGLALAGLNGSLFIADGGNFLRLAVPGPLANVSTVASARRRWEITGARELNQPSHLALFGNLQKLAVDVNSTLWFTTLTSSNSLGSAPGCIGSVSAEGFVSQLYCGFSTPNGMSVDSPRGRVFVSDSAGWVHKVFSVDINTGVAQFIAGGSPGSPEWGMWADGTGAAAAFSSPMGIATNSNGVIYVADQSTNIIRRVAYSGSVDTILGSGSGSGSSVLAGNLSRYAVLSSPRSIAVRPDGALVILDSDRLWLGQCQMCPASYYCFKYSMQLCPPGHFCPANSTLPTPCPAGTTSPAASASQAACQGCALGRYCTIGGPGSIACPAGRYGGTTNLASSACSGACTASAGYACAAGSTSPAGTQCPPSYYCPGGGSQALLCSCSGACSTAGLAAEPPAAQVWTTTTIASPGYVPVQLALSSGAGPLYMTTGHRVFKQALSGSAAQLLAGAGSVARADGFGAAASFYSPTGIAEDPVTGFLFVADSGTNIIRKIDPATQEVSTLAGSGQFAHADGQGPDASFNRPSGLVVTAAGVILVSDTNNHVLRSVTQAGYASTLVGTPGVPGAADSPGPTFKSPNSLALNAATGDVFISDAGQLTIRKLTPGGTVTTVAGSGVAGKLDSAIGTQAVFSRISSLVVVDASGTLVVVDTPNNCLRMVRPSGAVTTLTGVIVGGLPDSGAPGWLYTQVWAPSAAAVAPSGAIYWYDRYGLRRTTCGVCPEGGYCQGGAFFPCPLGHYCPVNSAAPEKCPVNTYTLAVGLANASQCANCSAGYACRGAEGLLAPLTRASDSAAVATGPLSSGLYWLPKGGCSLQLVLQGAGGGQRRQRGGPGRCRLCSSLCQ